MERGEAPGRGLKLVRCTDEAHASLEGRRDRRGELFYDQVGFLRQIGVL
jgi:hypothetical protein